MCLSLFLPQSHPERTFKTFQIDIEKFELLFSFQFAFDMEHFCSDRCLVYRSVHEVWSVIGVSALLNWSIAVNVNIPRMDFPK
jgi:hypothetical protein